MEDKEKVRFEAVDATNYNSLRKALEGVNGPLCINTEGLFMYLTDNELEALCSNIEKLLEEFGGCWVLADPESLVQFVSTLVSLIGQEKTMELLNNSRAMYKQKSDVSMGENFLVGKDIRDMASFFKSAYEKMASFNLKAERIPVINNMPDLNMLAKLDEEKVKAYKAAKATKTIEVECCGIKAGVSMSCMTGAVGVEAKYSRGSGFTRGSLGGALLDGVGVDYSLDYTESPLYEVIEAPKPLERYFNTRKETIRLLQEGKESEASSYLTKELSKEALKQTLYGPLLYWVMP